MALVISLLVVGWVAVAIIGTQAYFRGEQSKPIHARNWNSNSFEAIAESFTGSSTDFSQRVPGFVVVDAYNSRTLSDS